MTNNSATTIIVGSFTFGALIAGALVFDYYAERESHFQQEIMVLKGEVLAYKILANTNIVIHYNFGPGGFGNGNDKTGNAKKPAPPENLGAVEDNSADWTNRLPIIIRGGSGIMQETK